MSAQSKLQRFRQRLAAEAVELRRLERAARTTTAVAVDPCPPELSGSAAAGADHDPVLASSATAASLAAVRSESAPGPTSGTAADSVEGEGDGDGDVGDEVGSFKNSIPKFIK